MRCLWKLVFSYVLFTYDTLGFASGPAKPQICTIWPFAEKVCRPLLYIRRIFLLLLPTASSRSGSRHRERSGAGPAVIIRWGKQAIVLLGDKEALPDHPWRPALSFAWVSAELCSYLSPPSTGLRAPRVQGALGIPLRPRSLVGKCTQSVC